MIDDDFLLDDEDEELDSQNIVEAEEDEDENDSGELSESEEDVDLKSGPEKEEAYKGKMTGVEIYLSSAYNDIIYAASKDTGKVSVGGGRTFDAYIVDAVRAIIGADPNNTSQMTTEHMTNSLFHAQGHSRIVSSLYTPDPLNYNDLDDRLGGSDDAEFNQEFAKEAREQIARFIDYLAKRDLSKDSIISRRRKQRQIPAFIIFLFSSGMYDLIIDCPTMPEEYAKQITKAMERLNEAKYAIVEGLATRYDQQGRTEMAAAVRKKGVSWFKHEPAEIRTKSEYKSLNPTQADVVTYREFRSKFNNVSKSLTQDVIAELIEVVVDKEAGIFERLKDKTRTDAIADVKQVFKAWSKENTLDSSLASRIIWKESNDED